MPSGITQDVYDGSNADLRDYLMRVGRQMMFSVLQRDEGPGPVRIPEDAGSGSRYAHERVREAEARIAELQGMDTLSRLRAAHAAHVERLASWTEIQEKKAVVRARYADMQAKLEAWEPEPLVAYVKEHALRYLAESIEYDCPDREPKFSWDFEPVESAPSVWWVDAMNEAVKRRDMAREDIEKYERVERERREHVEAFYRSLPPEHAEVPA